MKTNDFGCILFLKIDREFSSVNSLFFEFFNQQLGFEIEKKRLMKSCVFKIPCVKVKSPLFGIYYFVFVFFLRNVTNTFTHAHIARCFSCAEVECGVF